MEKLLNMTAFYFMMILLLGILVHAVINWTNGKITTSLFVYFFVANKKATVRMILVALGGLVTALLTGTVYDLQDGAHLLAVWGFGFAADSAFNNDKEEQST